MDSFSSGGVSFHFSEGSLFRQGSELMEKELKHEMKNTDTDSLSSGGGVLSYSKLKAIWQDCVAPGKGAQMGDRKHPMWIFSAQLVVSYHFLW